MGRSIKTNRSDGFTIVELLIVIVVIGILATVVFIAYNGIQQRAKFASAQSAAAQAAKLVARTAVESGSDIFPSGQAEFDALKVGSGDATYQYSANNSANPKTFCITATVQNVSVYINNTTQTSPANGGCPGHGQAGVAAVTNLVLNPSSNTTVYAANPANNSNCVAALSSDAQSGANSTLLTKGNTHCFASVMLSNVYDLTPGAQYRLTAWVKSPQSTVLTVFRFNGSYSPQTITVTPNTWSKITRTFTMAAGQNRRPQIDIGYENNALPQGSQFRVDNAIVTEGAAQYEYADGDTANWAWNGTPHASTSSGPPNQ